MSHKVKTLMLTGLFLLVILVGCSSQSVSVPGSNLENVEALLREFQNGGVKVELNGKLTQPFFSPEGQILSVNGADVQVFVYESETLAGEEAAKISQDGGIGTTQILWVDTPHFFQQGRLIVLYIGQDGGVIRLLESVVGDQIP